MQMRILLGKKGEWMRRSPFGEPVLDQLLLEALASARVQDSIELIVLQNGSAALESNWVRGGFDAVTLSRGSRCSDQPRMERMSVTDSARRSCTPTTAKSL